MKKTKRFAAAVAAMALALSMTTVTAFAVDPNTDPNTPGGNTPGSISTDDPVSIGDSYSITISNSDSSDKGVHTYKYVQLLTGDFVGKVISNAEFSTAFKAKKAEIATALNGLRSNEPEFNDLSAESAAQDFAKAISALKNKAEDVAKVLKANLAASATQFTNKSTTTVTDKGYYLIFDADTSPADADGANSGAKSAFILKVVGAEQVNIDAKASAPTVDKQVEDNDDGVTTGDNANFGETADHAIGEVFRFKLTATIPPEEYIDKYKKYSLRFVDTIDSSIDFVAVESVKVGDTLLTTEQYSITFEGSNQKIYFYIDDIKLGDKTADIKGATVEIIYTAKLNSEAKVAGAKTDINKNTVKLEYSNNPNYTGNGELGSNTTDGNGEKNENGETPEDTVGVYTYKINNIKKDGDTGASLGGAKFKLTTIKNKDAEGIKFTFNSEKNAYIPDSNGSAEITSIESLDSGARGMFNIVGLDAGEYYLYETKVPDVETGEIPYNLLSDPIKVTITATHYEKANTNNEYELSLDIENGNNTVNNVKGNELPETGGIGTTMFYVGGGVMAAAAGAILIAKKRAKKEEQ